MDHATVGRIRLTTVSPVRAKIGFYVVMSAPKCQLIWMHAWRQSAVAAVRCKLVLQQKAREGGVRARLSTHYKSLVRKRWKRTASLPFRTYIDSSAHSTSNTVTHQAVNPQEGRQSSQVKNPKSSGQKRVARRHGEPSKTLCTSHFRKCSEAAQPLTKAEARGTHQT